MNDRVKREKLPASMNTLGMMTAVFGREHRSRSICRFVPAVVLLGLFAVCFDAPAAEESSDENTRLQKALSQARDYVEEDKSHSAIRLLGKIIKKHPKNIEARILRGRAYMQVGAWNRAVDDFSVALDANPNNAPLSMMRGDAYLFAREYEKALADFTSVLSHDSKSADAYVGRGLALTGMERYVEAVKEYQWALHLEPTHRDALYNLARASMLAGRPLTAVNYFERALERETDPKWKERIEESLEAILRDSARKSPFRTGGPVRSGSKEVPRRLW